MGVCGYPRPRGFTRTRPVPAGRVRVGYAVHGSGRVRVWPSRVRVYPLFTRKNVKFLTYNVTNAIVKIAPSKTYYYR